MNQSSMDRDLLPPERRILSGNTFDRRYDYGCAIERSWGEGKKSWAHYAYFVAVAIAIAFAIFALIYSRGTP